MLIPGPKPQDYDSVFMQQGLGIFILTFYICTKLDL